MDYSRSIMEIVEAHLSPTPTSDGRVSVGSKSISGTNSDIDAAIVESGVAPFVSHSTSIEQSAKISKSRRSIIRRQIVKGG